MTRTSILIVLAALLGIIAGCTDQDPTATEAELRSVIPTTGHASYREAIQAELGGADRNLDNLFEAMAKVEPWFGGMFISDDQLYVVSTEPTVDRLRAGAIALGMAELGRTRDLSKFTQNTQIVMAQFSFSDLADWRDDLSEGFSRYGVNYVDIDEVRNVIRLGTRSSSFVPGLEGWIKEAGVPAGAVAVHVQGIPQMDNGRWGGDSINVRLAGTTNNNLCTLTQVVEHHFEDATVDTLLYGITNSHCTSTYGDSTGDFFRRNGNIIADEVWDHPLVATTRCQSATGSGDAICRYSDAALFRFRSAYTGGLNVHDIRPTLDSLHAEETAVLYGETVNMYGRTSLLESGTVIATCIDTPTATNNPTIWQLCQMKALYDSEGGDSGGPVWVKDVISGDTIRLFAGIHWGHLGDTAYFSKVQYLGHEIQPEQEDFGTICLSFDSRFCPT